MTLFQDKLFLQQLSKLAAPIILQNLIMTSLNAVDVIMIGQLGDKSVAAVGLADQLFFLLILLLFGFSSGAAIFTAQYWGKKDVAQIQQVLGLCLILSMSSSFIFSLGAIFMPQYILSIYTNDPEVIKLGSQFLQIIGWSYVITSITFSYATVLRSVEQVKLPMLVSLIALATNTLLNYLLIFGHVGFPALGVQGSAIATCIARYLECFLMLMLVYRSQSILAAPIANLFTIPWHFLPQFFKTTLPVVLTEVLWSIGITVYNIIYAHISTESITATNIAGTIERVAFVLFLGVGSAGAVMIGNLIGANQIDLAKKYARYFITIAPTTAVIIGLMIFISRHSLLTFYDISPLATDYTLAILAIMSFALPLKATNFTMLVAVIRSGGDTRFALMLESLTIWVIGVPLAFLGAFVWHLPVYWVYLLVMTEELVKCIIGLYRVQSGKWVNNLVHDKN